MYRIPGIKQQIERYNKLHTSKTTRGDTTTTTQAVQPYNSTTKQLRNKTGTRNQVEKKNNIT